MAPPYLCEALSGATKSLRTASTGYRALLRVFCVVAGPLGASRFAAVSQQPIESSAGRSHIRSGPGGSYASPGGVERSPVALVAILVAARYTRRAWCMKPQTAEGVRRQAQDGTRTGNRGSCFLGGMRLAVSPPQRTTDEPKTKNRRANNRRYAPRSSRVAVPTAKLGTGYPGPTAHSQ